MPETDDRDARLVEQIRHHFGTVAESLESKIQIVVEGVASVNETLDWRLAGVIVRIEEGSLTRPGL